MAWTSCTASAGRRGWCSTPSTGRVGERGVPERRPLPDAGALHGAVGEHGVAGLCRRWGAEGTADLIRWARRPRRGSCWSRWTRWRGGRGSAPSWAWATSPAHGGGETTRAAEPRRRSPLSNGDWVRSDAPRAQPAAEERSAESARAELTPGTTADCRRRRDPSNHRMAARWLPSGDHDAERHEGPTSTGRPTNSRNPLQRNGKRRDPYEKGPAVRE
jgi:hypothetical protein